MPTRAAFARTGPLVRRSPSSSLLCSPPTPLLLRPRLRSRSLSAYLDVDGVLVGGARIHSRAVLRGLVTGPPLRRIWSRRDMGLPGSWAVLFARAVIHDSAGRAAVWPWRRRRYCLREIQNPRRPEAWIFRSWLTRPTCSRTYASPAGVSLLTSQGSLPACPARLWPDGICTRWTTYRISTRSPPPPSLRTSLAWSHVE